MERWNNKVIVCCFKVLQVTGFFVAPPALLPRLLRSGAGGVVKLEIPVVQQNLTWEKILVHARTFTHSFFSKHGRDRLVVSPVAQRHGGSSRQSSRQPFNLSPLSSRDPWLSLSFFLLPTRREDLSEYWDNARGGRRLAPTLWLIPPYSATIPPPPHTHGFGRNSKDHIDFTGQSRSSPPWGLWEAESNVGFWFFFFLEGLVQSGAVLVLLWTNPRPSASSIRRSWTPLSGTSLWLDKGKKKHC